MKIKYSQLLDSHLKDKKAYWLVDSIAAHLKANKRLVTEMDKNERLKSLSIWKLIKGVDNAVNLVCIEDTDMDPIVNQHIPYSDYEFGELEEFKLYCGLNYDEHMNEFFYIFLPEEY